MEIHRKPETPRRLGEELRFDYQSAHFRLVVTHVPPGHVQNMHSHRELYDCTYVISGEVAAVEVRDGTPMRQRLRAGDLVVLPPGFPHTVQNETAATAVTLTLKFVEPTEMSAEAFARKCLTDWNAEPDGL